MVAFLEGIPAGLRIDIDAINGALKRRQGGYGRGGRMAIEADQVEILSGLRKGVTIGSPLTLVVRNRDHRIDKAPDVTSMRPGHVDLAGCLKYATDDARNVLERASARDTCVRVAAGSVCAQLLGQIGVQSLASVVQLGATRASAMADVGLHHRGQQSWSTLAQRLSDMRRQVEASDFALLTDDEAIHTALRQQVDDARQRGDTLGGTIEVVVAGLPPGLGSHTQWDRKLDGQLAQALMSIPAIKAVEVGIGAEAGARPGSSVHDAMAFGASGVERASNRAGGLEGGITNGEVLLLRATMKPISTLMQPLPSIDLRSGKPHDAARERSDVCALPAASVVCEFAVAIPLASACLEKFGGDSMTEFLRNYEGYMQSVREMSREGRPEGGIGRA